MKQVTFTIDGSQLFDAIQAVGQEVAGARFVQTMLSIATQEGLGAFGEMGLAFYGISASAENPHPDNQAVNIFAQAMKAKMAKKRDDGRSGWQDCPDEVLSQMLFEHLGKDDPVDIGNIAMMIYCNRARRNG